MLSYKSFTSAEFYCSCNSGTLTLIQHMEIRYGVFIASERLDLTSSCHSASSTDICKHTVIQHNIEHCHCFIDVPLHFSR